MTRFPLSLRALALLTAGVLSYAHYLVFLVVPNERTMGAIQRIFYFHVGSAMASSLCFGVVFIAAILFLRSHKIQFDALSVAAGEVGFLFCTIVLLSGMIWGHTAWNTWFRFEPRLVTFLFLWLIFLSFVLLRLFGDPARIARHSAVLGILGAVTVPLMIYSIKLLPAAAQLHPQVIEQQGLKSPSYILALNVMMLGCILLATLFVILRYKIEMLSYGKRP
jgi:heme exporter protein C